MIYLIDTKLRGDKMHTKRFFISVITIILTLCILLSSCAVGSVKFRTGTVIDAKPADSGYHTFSGKSETVAKNEFIELSIDKNNHSIIVKDLLTNYTWNALPERKNETAYTFGLTLYTANGIYKLNTQDNSVAFSSSSFNIDNGKLSVSYILSDNKETAKKSIEEMTKNDIFVCFNAVFSMKDQSVYLDIDLSQTVCTDGAFISDFSVMPFFGASYSDSADDYFLIPDNSGAVMHLAKNDAATDNVKVHVYGENPYNEAEYDSASATVPVFGIKRSNSAFSAVITDGDALAVINAKRASNGEPSVAYPELIITEVKTTENNSLYKGLSYDGKISIAYKFLSDNNANYSGMATVSREEFISNSVLSSSKTDIQNEFPFYLTVVGQADSKSLTTINQTKDILGILKGKGINNIILSYKGLLSGGIAQKNLYTSAVSNKLGGKTGLEELYEYTRTQNCTLMLGTNIFSSSKNFLPTEKSLSIQNDTSAFVMRNDLAFNNNAGNSLYTRIGSKSFQLGKEKMNSAIYSQTPDYIMNLMNINKLHDKFQTYLEDDIFSVIDGITVTDAGQTVYSDQKNDRQTAMNTVSSLLRAVSNYGKLCVEGGNIYSIYNADIVAGMEFDTFYPESEHYESVPFAQSVLHGTVLYSGNPIDAGNPLYRYEMLRYIEYGAVPSYEWIYSEANIYCYSGYLLSERISEIVEFYNDATAIFTDLADDTIINHRKIKKDADGKPVSGVYCTTYSDGTEIYVNYTGNIVSTSENIAIGPYDYVSVKR